MTTAWELLETELADLYAIFSNRRFEAAAYDEYYEQGKTAHRRISTMQKAAEHYFISHSDQTLEGEFCALIRKVAGFAARRHEVAHGVARPSYMLRAFIPDLIEDFGKREYDYFLVPPLYQRGWFDNRHPKYIYTSRELEPLTQGVWSIFQELGKFKMSLPPS